MGRWWTAGRVLVLCHLLPLASRGHTQAPAPGPGDSPGGGWGQGWALPPTWFSLCCRLSSSCSKGHCSRLASSSSFFFLMSWFRLRCSRTRCSSGLLSTPRPLGGGSRQETPTSPTPASGPHPVVTPTYGLVLYSPLAALGRGRIPDPLYGGS